MRFPTMWYVRPAYAQSDQSLCLSLEYSMSVKLLTEHLLEVLSLKGGCTGSSESTLVKLLEITCHGSYLLDATTLPKIKLIGVHNSKH